MWRHFRNSMFTVLHDTPGDGGAGGGGGAAPVTPALAPAPPSGSGGAAVPGGTGAPPLSGTPGAAGAPPTPAKQFTFAEDRGNWIPPHRLSEVATRAGQYELRAKQLEAMIAAGTGVKLPPSLQSPEDQQAAAAREELTRIFPELALLEKLKGMLPQLEEALPRLPDVLASGEQYWATQGYRTVQTLQDEVAKIYGVASKDLTPLQQQTIGNSFLNWLQGDSTLAQRYSRGDASIVQEFVTEWRNAFFEPARRVGQGGNGGLPPANPALRGRSDLPPAPRASGIPPAGAAPPTPKSEDEVHDAAFKSFAASLNSRR